jgi:hypothetical protein
MMTHKGCGGTLNEKAIVPYCAKCGKSKTAVERDNARVDAAPTPPPVTRKEPPPRRAPEPREEPASRAQKSRLPDWNRKRFQDEREALLYRSPKAEKMGQEARELLVEAGKHKFDKRVYDKVRLMFKKAAEEARRDEDYVTYALFDTEDQMIDHSMAAHQEFEAKGGYDVAEGEDEEQAD